MAVIQFSLGLDEPEVPAIRLTRSRDGSSGTATFYFEYPAALANENKEEITGMFLIDEEGEIVTREVKGKFVNGQAVALEARLIARSTEEWNRFMRFMERYSEKNGLEFAQSKASQQ